MKMWKITLVGAISILLLLVSVRNYFSPDFETVRKEFSEDQHQIDSLIEVFIKESKVAFIEINRDGTVTVAAFKPGVLHPKAYEDFDRVVDVDVKSGVLKDFLQAQGMSLERFQDIVIQMRNSGVASISSRSDEKIPHIEIKYPVRSGFCAWYWQTPLQGHSITELDETVFVEEDADAEGSHIINERWVAYRYCSM